MTRGKLRIGIIDLLTGEAAPHKVDWIYHRLFRRQFYGVMPQVVAAWCRRRGHSVFYGTYYGQRRPESLVPDDLDFIFIAAFTEASALAYALSKIFRNRGTQTVLGGPHARSFSRDATRYFDVVVTDCDQAVIDDILTGDYDRGTIASSGNRAFDVPLLEERRPDIETATHLWGRYSGLSVIPLLSSTGCPYDCDFCVDWNNPYRLRSASDLEADLKYAYRCLARKTLAFYDPNFGVNFNKTMGVMEPIQSKRRNGYIVESSLSILKQASKLARLKGTNCIYVAPGIESWANYGRKSGTGNAGTREKYDQVAEQVELISRYIPGVQTNFMFGSDADQGPEPVELTVSFIRRYGSVFPGLAVPIAFGSTPLRIRLRSEGRLLPLPPIYYFNPVPTLRFKNYGIAEFWSGWERIIQAAVDRRTIMQRALAAHQPILVRMANLVRSLDVIRYQRSIRKFRDRMLLDRSVYDFYNGNSQGVPKYYDYLLDRRLGKYSTLLGAQERHVLTDE